MLRRGNLDDLSAPGDRPDATTASLKDMNRTVRLPGSRGAWGGPDKDLIAGSHGPQGQSLRRYPLALRPVRAGCFPRSRAGALRHGHFSQRDAGRWMPSPWICRSGPDYVVGPGDGLAINLWGGVSQRMIRSVDREGRITLPEAGPVLVSGRTLGEVQESVQQVLRTQFRDISADVSLARLRTIRVYIVGEVAAPGAYDISSLSTPLNALFAAGGVTPSGLATQPETLSRQATHRRS